MDFGFRESVCLGRIVAIYPLCGSVFDICATLSSYGFGLSMYGLLVLFLMLVNISGWEASYDIITLTPQAIVSRH